MLWHRDKAEKSGTDGLNQISYHVFKSILSNANAFSVKNKPKTNIHEEMENK